MPATSSAERISYREAFERYVGIDPHTADGEATGRRREASSASKPPASLSPDDRDGWLDLLMVERVQPHLGQERPALLYDYPASQAALARVRPEAIRPWPSGSSCTSAASRLANGYHELLDPAELRARNAQVNAQRRGRRQAGAARGEPAAGGDGGRPAAVGGRGPGFRPAGDAGRRGARSIAEVMAFPFDRA